MNLRNILKNMNFRAPSNKNESDEESEEAFDENLQILKIIASYKTQSEKILTGRVLNVIGVIMFGCGLLLIFNPDAFSELPSLTQLFALATGPLLLVIGFSIYLLGTVCMIAGKADCINQRAQASMCYQDALLEKLVLQNDKILKEIHQARTESINQEQDHITSESTE
jgi:hypothetical protein